MDEQGLWALFYATGLPEVYLAIRQERADREEEAELPARTAFRRLTARSRQI